MGENLIERSSSVQLRRGQKMPLFGLGTWQMDEDAAYHTVLQGLELGYELIDTATNYANERAIGRALGESGVARDSLFITTKAPGNATDLRATLEQSLDELRTDYVDLWLLHWPPAKSYEPTPNTSIAMYEHMLSLRATGRARAIGVSNFDLTEIDQLISVVNEAPEVLQIAWSPFRYRPQLLAELENRSIVLEGYSPLQSSRLDDQGLLAVAARFGVTPAQVIVRWHLQHRVVVIPKSTQRDHLAENVAAFDLVLDESAMAVLDHLGDADRTDTAGR